MSTTAVATPTEKVNRARDSFEALYRKSRDDLYAYLAGLLGDRSAAEEVTAQAFERAWRRRRQLDPARGSARAWLFGIARNAALDELRRRARSGRVPDDPQSESPGLTEGLGADPAKLAIERTGLRQALDTLTGRERELVALKFFAGLSNAEIADVIGTSESNAGTRLHRVIQKLRRALDDPD